MMKNSTSSSVIDILLRPFFYLIFLFLYFNFKSKYFVELPSEFLWKIIIFSCHFMRFFSPWFDYFLFSLVSSVFLIFFRKKSTISSWCVKILVEIFNFLFLFEYTMQCHGIYYLYFWFVVWLLLLKAQFKMNLVFKKFV